MKPKTEGSIEVDAGEFRREWHNYSRLMIGLAATVLIAFVGSMFANAQWQARTEEKLVNVGAQFQRQDAKNLSYERQLETLNQYQSQINGRLGVIEERTSNTVEGIKRIENKLEKK